jgi:hypothetical protein
VKFKVRLTSWLLVFFIPLAFGATAAHLLHSNLVTESSLIQLEAQMTAVNVRVPRQLPLPGNESIEMALAIFSIKVPDHLDGPFYDEKLEDRGLTTGEVMARERKVRIGPSAFASWAVLGSTLAHEIEVHAQQSFFQIVLTEELVQFDRNLPNHLSLWMGPNLKLLALASRYVSGQLGTLGTKGAEREAYMHEINNWKRFGLSLDERRGIQKVMNRYYPLQNDKKLADARF